MNRTRGARLRASLPGATTVRRRRQPISRREELNRRTLESASQRARRRGIGRLTPEGMSETPGKRAFDNASFFRVVGVFHFKQRFLLMATNPPESGSRRSGEGPTQEAGEGTDDLDPAPSNEALRGEFEVRKSKTAPFSDAVSKREDKLRRNSRCSRDTSAETINRLQKDLQDQMIQSAERIRELEAQIEHLKITRFEAKRENYSMKTSLSWRLTWPLRLLREAGRALSRNHDGFDSFRVAALSARVATG